MCLLKKKHKNTTGSTALVKYYVTAPHFRFVLSLTTYGASLDLSYICIHKLYIMLFCMHLKFHGALGCFIFFFLAIINDAVIKFLKIAF